MEHSNAAQAATKLDTVLRMLLSSVESYREACTAKEAPPSEERILGIMRVQVRIMENLEQTIKQVVESYGPSVLQAHVEYIFLPLRLILQSSDWTDDCSKNPIRQSAAWKQTETAARAMECTTKLLGPLMPFKQSLDGLSSCTFSLPRENNVENKGLDRGDDCTFAVLQCIDTLLESANEQKSYEEEVCLSMEGHLVAQISFCCTMLLSPDSRKTSSKVQLQALHTLDTLMKVAPVKEMWQSYFPGLFTVLCKLVLSELRLAAAQATPRVSSSACRTLAKLLRVTLPAVEKQESDPMHVWKQVQQMAISADINNADQSAAPSRFLQEVYSRLPAPLILLLNLLPTASSPKLRQAASDLCRSILVETRSVWDQQETSNVLQSAIECCIALSRDKDARVVSAAKKTIDDYRRDSGRRDVDSAIGPRVLELIEELPALARSGRETEFRGKINLISGYLMLGGSLRSSLLSVADEIQTCLAVLFDVDFDSIQYAPRVETSDSWSVWQPDRCRFRFMTDEMASSAREMVHSLGVALGQKGASSYVDDCVANVLEACIATTHALEGPRQVNWLHEWIGFLVLGNEILVGAFKEPQSQSSTENKGASDHIQKVSKVGESRQSRKRLKRLHSLAGAILPVITTAPLWTLPTVLDNLDPESNKVGSTESLTITEVQDKPEVPVQTVSASALKGNAAMVCSLIELVSETVDLIGNDAESFLPVILFPLCEKASSQNHSQVQRTASLALHKVAMACGLSSSRELIRQNFDYLFGAMLSRTRRSGGQQTRGNKTSFPTAIPSIVQVVLRSATDVDATEDGVRLKRSLSDETCVSYVIELVNALVASFDNNLVILNKDPLLQASSAFELVEVFDSALSFIASTFGLSVEEKSDLSSDVPIPKEGVDWLSALEPFRLLESDGLTAKEGFEKIHNEDSNGHEANGDENNNGDETDDEASAAPSLEITNGELDFVSLALSRCSFFLSSPSLHVQMASCIGMQHAFALLGHVAMYTTPKRDEANGPKTTVLRHIGTSWPSIISRFRVLSSTVIAASSVKAVSIRSLHATAPPVLTDASTQMIFLSKLFELIVTMCEVSESFMVPRIENEVWPVTAKLLDLYIQQEKRNPHKQLSCDTLVSKDAIRKKAYVTEREKLLFSMLDFLTRIYRQEKSGQGLSSLIPATGTILLPFLANEGELQARTMRALKTMMLIDCDALWRPLLQLSHRPLPSNPLLVQNSVGAVVQKDKEYKTPLELAANELVEFIEALPEQALDIS